MDKIMKRTIKIIFIISIFILIILASLYFIIKQKSLTGKIIEKGVVTGKAVENKEDYKNHYSFTKAICNGTNYCQDYEITCEGNKTLKIKSITGLAVQFSQDWIDSRTKEQIEKMCG